MKARCAHNEVCTLDAVGTMKYVVSSTMKARCAHNEECTLDQVGTMRTQRMLCEVRRSVLYAQ